MDGPRLGGRGLLGRLERRQYANMGRPDVLIALVADPDLLIARKPGDERPDLVRAKAGAVQVLAQTHPDVIGVDASLPLQSVIQKVTTAVWLHVSRESP